MKHLSIVLKIIGITVLLSFCLTIEIFVAGYLTNLGLSLAMDFVLFVALTSAFGVSFVAWLNTVNAIVDGYLNKAYRNVRALK
jgi:hypothetical protein